MVYCKVQAKEFFVTQMNMCEKEQRQSFRNLFYILVPTCVINVHPKFFIRFVFSIFPVICVSFLVIFQYCNTKHDFQQIKTEMMLQPQKKENNCVKKHSCDLIDAVVRMSRDLHISSITAHGEYWISYGVYSQPLRLVKLPMVLRYNLKTMVRQYN